MIQKMTESSQNVVFVVYQHSSGKQDSFTLVWPNKVTIYGLIEKFILPKLKMKRIPKC